MKIVEKTIELIASLVNETTWGKITTGREMLKQVYDECCELGIGISNIDKENIMEEISDINMMLIYFCCKLPSANLDTIKNLFWEAIMFSRDHKKNESYIIKNIYRKMVHQHYNHLRELYEDVDRTELEIYDEVKAMVVCSLLLAYMLSNGTARTIDEIFLAITDKLKKRYGLYFESNKESIDVEEDWWKKQKKIEKEMPYVFCQNAKCENYCRLGGKGLIHIQNKLFCKQCGKKIDRRSILMRNRDSQDRREAFEIICDNLVAYYKGDQMIIALYVFNRVNDCLEIFDDLLVNNFPLEALIVYFSNKNTVPQKTVKKFLCKCFYDTFAFNKEDKRKYLRAKSFRFYVIERPKELLRIGKSLGLSKAEMQKILFIILEFLKKNYCLSQEWEYTDEEIWIDLMDKKHNIIWILLEIHEIIMRKKNISIIHIINSKRFINSTGYQELIDYFFVKNEFNIKRIVFEDESY